MPEILSPLILPSPTYLLRCPRTPWLIPVGQSLAPSFDSRWPHWHNGMAVRTIILQHQCDDSNSGREQPARLPLKSFWTVLGSEGGCWTSALAFRALHVYRRHIRHFLIQCLLPTSYHSNLLCLEKWYLHESRECKFLCHQAFKIDNKVELGYFKNANQEGVRKLLKSHWKALQ